MVTEISGDIFQSKMQTLVNPVNRAGVMGKGLALEFKNRYPEMFSHYKLCCYYNFLTPYVFKRDTEPWILIFPTKDHWKEPSKLNYILTFVDYLKSYYKQWGITSLAVPALGCGCGDLKWEDVRPQLLKKLEEFDIPIELYGPAEVVKR